MKKGKRIYLDYVAGAPLDKKVLSEYIKALKIFANPAAYYKEAVLAKKIYEEARKKIARILRARPQEIFFTSGGTESNNIALLGAVVEAKKNGIKTPHIIISSIEHKSILEPAKALAAWGTEVTVVDPDEKGWIDPKKIRDALTENTVLVSIMYVNNEIGTVEPITEIAKEIRRFRKAKKLKSVKTDSYPLFHTDACQAGNYFSLDVLSLGVDLMTLHSPKVYGPSGIGALFVKTGIQVSPVLFGGGQEKGLRSGRENTALAHAFSVALEISDGAQEKEYARIEKLREYFIKQAGKMIPTAVINGDPLHHAPNIVSMTIPGLDAEFAVIALDHAGIAISSVSSCMSTQTESYSYVVEEVTGSKEKALSTLRISFGRFTKKEEINDCLKAIFRVLSGQWIT